MICISEISLWPVPSPARSCFTLSMILHRATTMAHISGTIPRIWALTPGTSLVYSNLGRLPGFTDTGVPYEKALIFGGVVIFLFFFVPVGF